MKIARIRVGGAARVGIVEDDVVHLLTADTDMAELLSADPAQRHAIVEDRRDTVVAFSSAQLLAPVQPPTLRDFLTFEEHLLGSMRLLSHAVPPPAWYDQPLFYFSNSNAVIGPDEDVEVPPGCHRLDFEVELAAVVGRPGKNLTVEEAADHIAGYTLFNDWSARDLMAPVIPVGMGPVKGKDFANTIGPWIVTADELEPYRDGDRLALRLHAELNGAALPAGDDTSANMAWSFEEMLAFASRGAELRTGDVLASGTCGAGSLLEYWAQTGVDQPPPLAPGDVVTLVGEGIGRLSSTVVAGVEPHPVPPARASSRLPERTWRRAT